ncbi:hypothetical protein NBRC116601_01180 [Cognatishimia sp. WU-CL00825]|uniref:hypothetical protein n=1 Tax=Cognatishimia sp. WU-CL00825 TaxID=3127658 RepID=UPI00310C1D62
MKFALKIALPLSIVAAPALAHSGAHVAPHGTENIMLGLAAIAVVAVVALRTSGK